MNRTLAAALAATTCIVGYATPAAAQAREYNIPSGSLKQALDAYVKQSGRQVMYRADEIRTARSKGAHGSFEARAALQAILADSGFTTRTDGDLIAIVKVRGAGAGDASLFEEKSTGAALSPEIIVSASRTAQNRDEVSSSVSVITPENLASQQVVELTAALDQLPGVSVSNTGGVGGTSAVYIRGAYAHHTLFVIDGIRMNDRAATYNNFLAGADVAGFDQIEVLRGPQSPLYGSSAMGGVILSNTSYGRGDLEAAASLWGGSFDTVSGSAAARGSFGDLGYSAAVSHTETDNYQPDNGYKSWNYSTRLNYALPSLDIGVTFRGQNGSYNSVGSRFFYSPGTVDTDNYLTTLYADWRNSDTVTTRITLGYHKRKYVWADSWGVSPQDNRRLIADWQTAWKPVDAVELVVGANYEDSIFKIGTEETDDRIISGFLSGTWRVTDTVTLNGGLRHDDYKTVGGATTWRSGLAWMVTPTTKLRGTYGTGFAAPGSSDRYGVPAWGQLPNPDIQPETSKGWDIGVEQRLLGDRATVSVSYFSNKFKNLIDWEYLDYVTYQGIYSNRARATTKGVEAGLTVRPMDGWHLQAAYTYLDAKDDDTGVRLQRVPRHSVNLSTWVDVTDRLTLGGGVQHVAGRYDGGVTLDPHTVARIFASFGVTDTLSVKVRVENLFDEVYDDTYGYTAAPRAVYGTVGWRI